MSYTLFKEGEYISTDKKILENRLVYAILFLPGSGIQNSRSINIWQAEISE
jgi:hypothetical protein